MNSEIQAFALGVLAGGVIGVITSYAGHIFSLRRDRQKEYHQAVSTFRAALLPVIATIKDLFSYDSDGGQALCNIKVVDILSDSYDQVLAAKTIFESHLSPAERRAFEAAWDQYTQRPKDGMPRAKFIAYESDGVPETETKCRNIALARMENLLSFARYQ